MALAHFPAEILAIIITHVFPEGFESFALTCKRIHALCTPFIERHNTLCSQFQHFSYFEMLINHPIRIRTAFDLITQIAVEPVVARYIQHANFGVDNYFTHGRPRELLADVHCRGAVIRLFAHSPYLKQAGLDWEEYYAKIEEDLEAKRYSQHAAAFLLTLLPNVRMLSLPEQWKPLDASDRLIEAVVHNAKQSHLPCDRPSLAQTTSFEFYHYTSSEAIFHLNKASPFLALPHVQSFYGPSCVAMDDDRKSIASRYPFPCFGEALETISLANCRIDGVGIADLLKNTTRLKTLSYLHSTIANGDSHCWDICKFITAIERAVGSHLVDLSVSIRDLRGKIAPGKVSMRGFQCLETLEFPLELAMCNAAAAAAAAACRDATSNEPVVGATDDEFGYCDSIIGDLVPASVTRLSLISCGADHHEKALDLMFSHFAANKDSQLPVLEDIHLAYPEDAGSAYKHQCARLYDETEKVGVDLYLEPRPRLVLWNGGH